MSILQSEQNKLKKLRKDFANEEQLLNKRYDNEAKKICPFKIGDEIEYQSGKRGKVDKIFFPKEWEALEDQEPNQWAVTGSKINKDGKLGKKNYHYVSGKTHVINGHVCRRKTLSEVLGIK